MGWLARFPCARADAQALPPLSSFSLSQALVFILDERRPLEDRIHHAKQIAHVVAVLCALQKRSSFGQNNGSTLKQKHLYQL